ncbi:CMGC/SRPK protein kinase [Penicillium sp. IBT 16267x]|nr:CMGC/SRPK protein kinase [Penicillium sp. IBT 16267x]
MLDQSIRFTIDDTLVYKAIFVDEVKVHEEYALTKDGFNFFNTSSFAPVTSNVMKFFKYFLKLTGLSWFAGLFKWSGPFYQLRRLIGQPAPAPFPAATTGFEIIDDSVVLEEEKFDHFLDGLFYPVNIGDVLNDRYTIIGKLGYGLTSTVWLAGDLKEDCTVALKIYARDDANEKTNHVQNEIRAINTFTQVLSQHPGRQYLRDAISSYKVTGPTGVHTCIVQEPMWQTIEDLWGLYDGILPPIVVKTILKQLLSALNFLHTECKLIHTDIKGDNIFQELDDSAVQIVSQFVQEEMDNPSPRKFVDGKPIYVSRMFDPPSVLGNCLLGDFGSAVRGDKERNHGAQPNFFRAPEVILKANWSYPVDIWNVGVIAWLWVQGTFLFEGQDPHGPKNKHCYATRAHLADIIGVLGPPPADLIKRGKKSREFFDANGTWKVRDVRIEERKLEKARSMLDGDEKEMFLDFIRGMLQWRPEDRKTAAELDHFAHHSLFRLNWIISTINHNRLKRCVLTAYLFQRTSRNIGNIFLHRISRPGFLGQRMSSQATPNHQVNIRGRQHTLLGEVMRHSTPNRCLTVIRSLSQLNDLPRQDHRSDWCRCNEDESLKLSEKLVQVAGSSKSNLCSHGVSNEHEAVVEHILRIRIGLHLLQNHSHVCGHRFD